MRGQVIEKFVEKKINVSKREHNHFLLAFIWKYIFLYEFLLSKKQQL